jgi:hypothetical protein
MMNDEKFEITISDLAGSGTYYADIADELRARDSAQREALARVEAERDELARCIELHDTIDAGIAQQQLAEAVKLIRHAKDELRTGPDYGWEDRLAGQLDAFLARHTQAEQQEAQPATFYDAIVNPPRLPPRLKEAQGAQADEFQREDRYIVIKRKDLDLLSPTDRDLALSLMGELSAIMANWNAPERQYLVVESDWPEYEPTWAAIQARVAGNGAQAGDELDAVAEAIFNADKGNWYSVGPYPQLHANDKARLRAMARAALATQPAEWADQLYTQGFDAGAAASKRLNAVRGSEHE